MDFYVAKERTRVRLGAAGRTRGGDGERLRLDEGNREMPRPTRSLASTSERSAHRPVRALLPTELLRDGAPSAAAGLGQTSSALHSTNVRESAAVRLLLASLTVVFASVTGDKDCSAQDDFSSSLAKSPREASDEPACFTSADNEHVKAPLAAS
mmetsp:Transcript_10627/g.28332  ORF Transcript_10627/g.28332 Transcript_10627/m.28332 type:complete len:154 (+) Transcript_10627:240-701(+)